jgi:S-(hydroxymethyl)glutathione dehydrogenase/alcohol dehydrogenase
MKAAVLHEIPGKLQIEDARIDAPGPREVLIRTAAAGLCHSDLHFIEGKYPFLTPTILGHESAGVVEAVGDQVTYVQPGDHVITCLSVFCGQCEYCLSGRMSICQSRAGMRAEGEPSRLSASDGTPIFQFANLSSFAEQMLVHEHAVVKIPSDVPLDVGALIGCGVTTGLGAVFNTAKVEPGTSVAVLGCGGVGLSCVQGAAIAGALRVIAVDTVPAKLEQAKQLGATDVVDAKAGDPVQAVIELTEGGVHYSFEAIGLKDTAEQSFAMLRPGGTATIIGMIPFGTKIELHGWDFLSERRIQGSTMGSNRFRLDMPRYIGLYRQGRLKLDEMITRHITLDDVNEGFDALARAEVTRQVIRF